MQLPDGKTLIVSGIVGSRLHGTHNEKSDTDFRGVFMVPLIDFFSPFREVKEAHWVEKSGADTDDTAYELSKFCKMCSQGNPSCLEVLVALPDPDFPGHPLGDELKAMLPLFITKKCYKAFRGYSQNQEKKMRTGEEVKESSGSKDRKWKYAAAHLRTMYQLLHLLKTGELVGRLPQGTVDEIKLYKDGRGSVGNFFGRIDELEQLCAQEFERCNLPDEVDTSVIEAFILKAYTSDYGKI